jgi:hypothetical protein
MSSIIKYQDVQYYQVPGCPVLSSTWMSSIIKYLDVQYYQVCMELLKVVYLEKRKVLKTPSVNRRTDNAMAKMKNKRRTNVDKTLHTKD